MIRLEEKKLFEAVVLEIKAVGGVWAQIGIDEQQSRKYERRLWKSTSSLFLWCDEEPKATEDEMDYTLDSDWPGRRTQKDATGVSIGCWLFKRAGDRSVRVALLMSRRREGDDGDRCSGGRKHRVTSEWKETTLWTDATLFTVNHTSKGVFI